MVENPRTETRADPLRPVNEPVPIEMDDNDNFLVRLCLRGSWFAVTQWRDRWRIDDEWWRERPVSRLYYRVTLEDGATAVLFRDLVDGAWYRQRGT